MFVPDFAFRELDLVRVKGKNEPVAIFEPLGSSMDMGAEVAAEMDEYAAALAAYRRKDWDSAAVAFEKLRQHTDQLLYNVYLDRIERFRREPPPGDWDGVFAHLTK